MKRRGAGGFTLVEVVCATAILLVLASLAVPVATTMVKRQKELELRRSLRTIREGIDRFQADCERIPTFRNGAKLDATNEEGYPQELAQLYEGVDVRSRSEAVGLDGTRYNTW